MFHQFIAFSVVVDEQSLNKAAKKLNISQPALSRKMLALETQLGITLFHRDGKRLEVTPLGYELYKQALEIKKLERSIMRTIATFEPTTTPTITIGASLTTLQASFPDLISKLSHAFPNITIKVITGKTHEITELMIAGKVELGLVATVVNHPEIICEPLFDDHLEFVLPKKHTLSNKKSPSIRDLDKLPMILFSKGTWYRSMMDDLLARYHLIPDIQMEIDSFEAIIRLVSTGNLATVLPKSYLRSNLVRDNQLQVLKLPELDQAVRTTSIMYPKYAKSAIVHEMAEAAIALYQSP